MEMKSWEINRENLERWSSECADVSDVGLRRGATYWRNVAFVLLRHMLMGTQEYEPLRGESLRGGDGRQQ